MDEQELANRCFDSVIFRPSHRVHCECAVSLVGNALRKANRNRVGVYWQGIADLILREHVPAYRGGIEVADGE